MSALYARFLEPEPFRAALRAGLSAGRHFTRAHPSGDFAAALTRTTDGGLLDDEAGAALADAALQVGEPAGSLDLAGDEAWARRFVSVTGAVLDDVALASQLLRGGWLGRTTRAVLGALPLRVIRRQVTAQTLARGRELVEVGWDSELINLLESAALRADGHPEHHLLIIGANLGKDAEEVPLPVERPSRGFDLLEVLQRARAAGAHDVMLEPDREATSHHQDGVRLLGASLSAQRVDALAVELGVTMGRVVGLTIDRVGRVRVARSRGGLAFRLLGDAPRLPPEVRAVAQRAQGLVVVGGRPASGRSSVLSALLHGHAAQGHVIASLEEPVSFPMSAFQFDSDVPSFLRAVRTSPVAVVGLDLVDDAQGLELALTLAREGRHVVATLRGVSLGGLVHRLAVLDASAQRRRLSEHLDAVVLCGDAPQVLTPSEALRRHLRGNESMPPPVLLEASTSEQ